MSSIKKLLFSVFLFKILNNLLAQETTTTLPSSKSSDLNKLQITLQDVLNVFLNESATTPITATWLIDNQQKLSTKLYDALKYERKQSSATEPSLFRVRMTIKW